MDGCSSSYRLESHHTIAWPEGGSTDAEDLVSLCWFHHEVAIHRLGLEILRLGTSRVRLIRPSYRGVASAHPSPRPFPPWRILLTFGVWSRCYQDPNQVEDMWIIDVADRPGAS